MLRHPALAGILAVVLGAIAAGLEGSVVPAFGGWLLGIGSVVGCVLLWDQPLPQPTRLMKAALILLGVILLCQWLPVPPLLRSLLAPGQARTMAMVTPEWRGDLDPWLDALTRFDLDAAVGTRPSWTYDLLVGAQDSDCIMQQRL